MIARAMLCIMLCLGATTAEAMANATPCRRRRELWRSTLASLPMLLTAAPIQLRAPCIGSERIANYGVRRRVDAVDRSSS